MKARIRRKRRKKLFEELRQQALKRYSSEFIKKDGEAFLKLCQSLPENNKSTESFEWNTIEKLPQ